MDPRTAAKFSVAFCLFAILMAYGYFGRRQAWLELRLDQLSELQSQLQTELETQRTWRPPTLLASNSGPQIAPPDPKARSLAAALSAALDTFNAEYKAIQLPDPQRLRLNLARSAIANSEQQYQTTLSLVPETAAKAIAFSKTNKFLIESLKLRADALFGEREIGKALETYQLLLSVAPEDTASVARSAECLAVLGKTNEAVRAYYQLAHVAIQSGNAALLRRDPTQAGQYFQRSVTILTPIADSGGLAMLQTLAGAQNAYADSLLIQKKAADAATQYEKAIALRNRLQSEEGQASNSAALAVTCNNAGSALLASGKPQAAMERFERTINFLEHLPKLPVYLTNELARAYNNRGVLQRANRKLDEALGNFDAAIHLLGTTGDSNTISSAAFAAPRVRLAVFVSFAENSIDLFTRTWSDAAVEKVDNSLTVANCLKNRAYARLSKFQLEPARADFSNAAAIYERLLGNGQGDLGPHLAKCLTPLAWSYATNPDPALRDGKRAREYAIRACQLSDWQVPAAIQALAAASAELGDFASAVSWQEKAIELAAPKEQMEFNSRLQLYKNGRPFRMTQQ